jgi:hypothetical protein
MSCIRLRVFGVNTFKERTMPTTQSEGDKKRRDPRAGNPGGDSEPQIPDVDPAELDDDQADSGPDRDHKELER